MGNPNLTRPWSVMALIMISVDDVFEGNNNMLGLIGLIALLGTIAVCRKPGVKFWSPITLYNRKEKLTDIGSKIYVVSLCVLLLGIVLRFTKST